MLFEHAYRGSSAVTNTAQSTHLGFLPDLSREPTYFRGSLANPIPYREAMGALHDIVVSDLRYVPKDNTAYLEWLKSRENEDLAQLGIRKHDLAAQVEKLQSQLTALRADRDRRWAPYYKARKHYFDYLYQKDRDAWFVLDPVISVQPDEVFFECFSQDESSYGRLSVDLDGFKDIGEFACGTTNVDYSAALYDEMQKIRTYKTTRLDIDPTGFEVETSGEPTYKEVKIDLPESWVRGFLQVSSAMTFPATRFTLHPFDVHNLCFVLRRHKEIVGPRSMRFVLKPGQPVKVVFDPWGTEVTCPRSTYEGADATEIRIWGRRRLHLLERLVPVAKKFEVSLLGTGMPSFWVADLGGMSFTLGLSGWTANDWSKAGNFDLMAPRRDVDELTRRRVFEALKAKWFSTPDALSAELRLDRATVSGALAAWTQAGRAIFDLRKQVYRVRELSREPLPVDALRFSNPREEEAARFVDSGQVNLQGIDRQGEQLQVRGAVAKKYDTVLVLDRDERLVQAQCTCNWYEQNKLYKGPCEHMLALRAVADRRLRKG